MFLRDGKPCELCLDGNGCRVLWNRCGLNSLPKALLALRLFRETRRRGLLSDWVDAYIALTRFGRQKFVAAGLPEEQVSVKPNFVDDPRRNGSVRPPGRGAVFIGRLSPEKGVLWLLRAWRDLDYPLTIVGDGPEMDAVRKCASPQVRVAGELPREKALQILQESSFMVFPSYAYEGCPLTVVEAMAAGRPVVASNLGPRNEMVLHGETGLLFHHDDPAGFQAQIRSLACDRDLCSRLGDAGRVRYLLDYTPEKNYAMLIGIYERALGRNLRGRVVGDTI
jgi:glycosyltransferase involved in cell wall biosynthesis